jgi:hypothetical protein
MKAGRMKAGRGVPKNITCKGKEPNHKRLVRITFWTPYPTRSGTIHSRIANLTVGQEIRINWNTSDTYLVTSSKVVDTPGYGVINEYSFTASPSTVKQWTQRIRLEEEKVRLVALLRGNIL